MAFPVTARTTGTLITATIWNSDLKDNLNALYGGALSVSGQAANGVPYTASATQLAILAAGASGAVLTSRGSGAAPAWGPSPIAMAIVFGG